MEWSSFPGLVGLVTRGIVFPTGYEPTISILTKCIKFLNHPIIGPTNSIALIVSIVLCGCTGYFRSLQSETLGLSNHDSTDCLSNSDHPLHNLATMMDQYKDLSFPRDRFQWTKCVVNYLIDAFNPNVIQLIVFITEMLERSAASMHIYLLNMINLFVSYGDLSDSSPVIRVISKHIQGVNSREASRILKSFVDQWNAISVTQVSHTELCTDQRKPNFELYVEKNIASASSIATATNPMNGGNTSGGGGGSSPQTPRKANPSATPAASSVNQTDSLKRQSNSVGQSKVRERLVSLLTASGLRVGLPKSSSVIFSQSTSDLHQDSQNAMAGCMSANNMQTGASNSAYSSSEKVSHQDDTLEALSSSSHIGGCQTGERSSITTDSFPRVFKEFDFLEAEHDSISESTDSCFNWLSTMRSPRCGVSHADGEEGDENAGDEHEDDFLHPEDGDYYEEDDAGSNGGHSGAGGNSGMNKDDEPATLRSKVALRSGRVFNVKPRRPLSRASRASDSNDISSDRTPIQSEKSMHSDDSCPSCPVSEEDEEEDIGEEDEEELDEPTVSTSHVHSNSKEKPKAKASSTRGKTVQQAQKVSNKQSGVQMRAASQTSSISPAHSNNRQPAGTEDSLMETASSIQCRSEFSARNRMAFSPVSSVVSSGKMPIYLECNHHTSGQVEQMWNSVVLEVANDQDGELISHSIMLFSQLLRESCVKMSVLLRDACHLLTMPGSLSIPLQPINETSTYFTHALNVVLTVADCPFLFATPQFLRSSNLLQTQKFALYELREHFETFSERREQCIRALNSLKSSLKLFSIGNSMTGGPVDSFSSSTSAGLFSSRNQEIELCKCLHKLFFQLLLMLEKLYEMIQVIQQSSNSQEYDLSPAVACLQRDLLGCLSEVPASQVSSASMGSTPQRNVGEQPKHSDTLVLHLANKQYKNALMSLRQLRCQYGSEEYGCCDHMDVEVLLVHFCRSHTLRTWAIVGSLQCLRQSCSQLKETNMQLAGLVRLLMTEAGAGNNSSRSSRMFGSGQQQQQQMGSGSIAGGQMDENTSPTSN
uniref:Uncharacterized protein n=1 Tax=Ditylenchus dipsaci TaxID=166011 RepID=A0A915EUA5_9BILA